MSFPKPVRNGMKSMSFNGKSAIPSTAEKLRRPKTMPELKSSESYGVNVICVSDEIKPKKLTKVLLNVTVQGSVGAVQVLISPELTVKDLISAAVKQYVKEGRRPVISCTNFEDFDLHYSQFSLESLDKEEKIIELGSRNFFLCKRRREVVEMTASCSKEAENATNIGGAPFSPWLKFITSFLN